MKELSEAIAKAEECVQRCGVLTEKAARALPAFEEPEESLVLLKELLAFHKELAELCIEHESFLQYRQLLGRVLSWIDRSRLLIKGYHKSLDL